VTATDTISKIIDSMLEQWLLLLKPLFQVYLIDIDTFYNNKFDYCAKGYNTCLIASKKLLVLFSTYKPQPIRLLQKLPLVSTNRTLSFPFLCNLFLKSKKVFSEAECSLHFLSLLVIAK
jgi:hypothetical protein